MEDSKTSDISGVSSFNCHVFDVIPDLCSRCGYASPHMATKPGQIRHRIKFRIQNSMHRNPKKHQGKPGNSPQVSFFALCIKSSAHVVRRWLYVRMRCVMAVAASALDNSKRRRDFGQNDDVIFANSAPRQRPG